MALGGGVDADEDIDDIVQDMRQSGASEEAIEKFLADSQADEEEDDAEEDQVDVLPANILIVDTFLCCQWDRAIAPDGRMLILGISSGEIRAAAEMVGVPRELWHEVITGVRTMESVAAPQLRLRNR